MSRGPSPTALSTRIPGPVRGALWMVTFCFLLASQAVFIRRVSAEIHPFEIVLFRNAFALLFLAPVYWHFGIEGMRTRAWDLYVLAFIFMGASPLAWFLAIAMMPMAEMIALTFTSPLFGTIGGALILGEIVRWRRWAAIVAGFVGAMIILRPGVAAVSPPALIALLVALESEEAEVLVVDMVEQGLDHATQEALIAHLRHHARRARPIMMMTRSCAILDLDAVEPDETIILCPANHSPPTLVAPYPGSPGYESVATCLASPEVRARTEGLISWRPEQA